jgi:hypothetical protein
MKSKLHEHATEFRKLAEGAWSEETAYPGLYTPQRPSRGQCGISSFGLGLWLVQKHGYDASDLSYDRGLMLDNMGRLITPNQSWLDVTVDDKSWQVDVTPDQYDGIGAAVFVRPLETGSEWYPIIYVPEKMTPLAEYDTARFSGRLAVFAEAVGIEV